MKKLGLALLLAVVLAVGFEVQAVPGFSEVRVNTGNGFGSVSLFAQRFTNIDVQTGTAITYSQSFVNGDSFTINTSGVYGVSYSDGSTTGDVIAISLNAGASSSITDIGVESILCRQSMPAGFASSCSVSVFLNSGDIVRAHRALATDGGINTSARFIILGR